MTSAQCSGAGGNRIRDGSDRTLNSAAEDGGSRNALRSSAETPDFSPDLCLKLRQTCAIKI
jgi:hypothetical protein